MDAAYHPDLAVARHMRELRKEYDDLNEILRTRPHDLAECHRFRELEDMLGMNENTDRHGG